MTTITATEPDALEGAPHPRLTEILYGQSGAEADFLAAFNTSRLHHGWLITGPRGVGKATLAWKIARFLLTQPENDGGMFAPPAPSALDSPADHPVLRRSRALSETRLFLLRNGYDEKKERFSDIISVDEMRKMRSFFTMSAADGGRRVAIIDTIDDMNIAAANALLKTLEEPPAKVTLLLISHQPAKLLPTIRSRCRALRLGHLGPQDMALALSQAGGEVPLGQETALAELAAGSVGAAFRMVGLDGLDLYAALVKVLATLPNLSRPMAIKLAQAGAAKGAQAQFDLIVTLIDLLLARLARAGASGQIPPEAAPGEAALIRRLSPDPDAARRWADLAQSLGVRARRGKAVNLDPFALLMDMVLRIEQTAQARA
jgi:DNA polymerase-3 subunit delta'